MKKDFSITVKLLERAIPVQKIDTSAAAPLSRQFPAPKLRQGQSFYGSSENSFGLGVGADDTYWKELLSRRLEGDEFLGAVATYSEYHVWEKTWPPPALPGYRFASPLEWISYVCLAPFDEGEKKAHCLKDGTILFAYEESRLFRGCSSIEREWIAHRNYDAREPKMCATRNFEFLVVQV